VGVGVGVGERDGDGVATFTSSAVPKMSTGGVSASWDASSSRAMAALSATRAFGLFCQSRVRSICSAAEHCGREHGRCPDGVAQVPHGLHARALVDPAVEEGDVQLERLDLC
jgi:hypothetical protein